MRRRAGAIALAATVVGLLAAAGASAQVSVGHSGWFWGDPRPQGEPLIDVSFAGGIGYTVGRSGTVLRSTDGGSTWTGLATGLSADLSHVDAVSATTVIVSGTCVLRRSDDGGNTWVRVPWTGNETACANKIAAVDFPTSNAGYLLLADGTILRTIDGGRTWGRAGAPSGTPTAIAFSSATVGLAAGAGIFRTADGGSRWSPVDPAAASVASISVADPTHVLAVNSPASMLYSSGDGGLTWSSTNPTGTVGENTAKLACASATNCLLATVGGQLLHTGDGGTSFGVVGPPGLTLFGVAFANPSQAAAVGDEGIPAVSSDGGAMFSAVGGRLPSGFHRLRVTSATLATMSGPAGQLALTVNGGQSWAALVTPSGSSVVDTSFVNGVTGFALDATGSLLRTDTGGASWSTFAGATGEAALLALDGRHIVLAGPSGVKLSSDGGQTFLAAVGSGLRSLNDLARAGQAVFAWGPGGAFVSANGGSSFKRLAVPARERVRQLDFLSSRAGYLLATDGRVFTTSDAGAHWRESLGLGRAGIVSIAFAGRSSGWAAQSPSDGTAGAVLRTDDGGSSWRPQRVADGQIDTLGASGHEGYALADNGNLFASGTSGDLGGASSISLKAPRRAIRGVVTLSGRLGRPALVGTQVVLSYRSVTGGRWTHANLTTGKGGSFSLKVRIRSRTAFVVQWAGNTANRSVGSRAAVVATG
jgi:photosystem II stability/assembly factor-like uncharacterized protein